MTKNNKKQEEVMVRLGTTLRFLRGRTSLRELADTIGVKHTFLFRIESGTVNNPSIFLIHRIAEHFGMTLDELMNFKATTCPTCKGRGWVKR